MAIRDFAEKQFVPDVLRFLATKNRIFRKSSVGQVDLYGFEFCPNILEGFVSDEVRYDLYLLEDLLALPFFECTKCEGSRLIGSAIRVCNVIGKQEHADTFKKIVGDCFTPEEQRDPTDPDREFFDLPVEPSTGRRQCECCKDD
jgi:hypothetical protein